MKRARVLGAVVCAIATSAAACHSKKDEPRGPAEAQVVLPERRDLERTIDVPGDVRAYFQATMFAQVAGYVKAMHFDKGDLVREGDVIAEIDVPELEAARSQNRAKLEQAHAALKRAEVAVTTAKAAADEARAEVERAAALAKLQASLHERAEALHADKDISLQELEIAAGKAAAAHADERLALAKLEAAKAQVEHAEAEVAVARSNVAAEESALDEVEARLEYAIVRAPFDGVVTARFVDPGALIQQATRSENAQRIVTCATRGRVRVDFELPEAEVAFVHSGSPIVVRTAAYAGRDFRGAVTRVASALTPETRTMLCEAELANEDNALLPGMYVTVHATLEVHRGALVLPPGALQTREGGVSAFVVEDDAVARRTVERGWDFGRFVEVRSGIDANDRVVYHAGELQEGERVAARVVEWSSQGEEAKARKDARPAAKPTASPTGKDGSP